MIGILDYGAGNLLSVAKAFRFLGFEPYIIKSRSDLEKASKIVIPGVGSFGSAMKSINRSELTEPVLRWIKNGDPVLGICLGMQMFFDSSEESPEVKGLGLIKGTCRKLRSGKVPNMGWLETFSKSNSEKKWLYYVHSYFVEPENASVVDSTATYGEEFTASVIQENIFGVQFHPEKSGKDGLELLKRWGSK